MRSAFKARLARLAAFVVRQLAPKLVAPPRPIPRQPVVLVIRCDHLGDAVMATAVLGPLREHLDASRLDVLAAPWTKDIVATHPAVDTVLTVSTPWWMAARGAGVFTRLRSWWQLPGVIAQVRRARYDIVIDLRGDLRQILCFVAWSGAPIRVSTDRTGGAELLTHCWPFDANRHEIEKNAAIVATLGVRRSERPTLRPPTDAQARQRPEAPYVVFALRGSEANREWPVAHAAALAIRLHREHSVRTVLVGAAKDVAYAEAVVAAAGGVAEHLAGRTTLLELMTLLVRAQVAVCVDSGPMHVAAAVDTAVVALFGPGNPAESGPWGWAVTVLAEGAPCGCVHPWCSRPNQHGDGPGACMAALSPDAVYAAVRPLLWRSQHSSE